MDAPSPRLPRKASSIPPALNPVLKTLGLEEEDPEDVFEIHSKEGAGAFGRVFRATYRREPTKLAALKVIPIALEAGQRGEDIENVRREIQFLRECDHPNVVAFFGAYYKDSALWVAMEYCGGGSVGDVSRHRKLGEEEIAVIMRGALQGLAYLHARKKIHRDIKGGNILLTTAGEVKIADFGVSAQLKDTMSRRGTFVGTPYWMSPEMIQDSDYDYKSDIWSLGITMIELADQKPPLFDEHPMRVLIQIPRNPPPGVKHPHSWTPLFSQFLQFCLKKDPKERPSAAECLEHEFIKRSSHVAFVYAEGAEARAAMAATGDSSVSVENAATASQEQSVEVAVSVRKTIADLEREDSEAMSDDVTLRAAAARPPRPSLKPPSVDTATRAPPASSQQLVSPASRRTSFCARSVTSDDPGTPRDDRSTSFFASESALGTPRGSESVVEEAWDEHSQSMGVTTSSRTSESDEEDGDDDHSTEGNDAGAEGFAFRQAKPRSEVATAATTTSNPETPAASMDDSFEMPAMDVISKIHAAATTLAGHSVRQQAVTPPVPMPIPAAASPIPRNRKLESPSTDKAIQSPSPVANRRDLSSFSRASVFSRSNESSPRRSDDSEAAMSPSDGAGSWSNPLAGLAGASNDRVNTLLSSISASRSRLAVQPERVEPPPFMADPSASLRSSFAPLSASSSSHFIGAPFRVSHQLCVKYNTLDAKFEGVPNSQEWATVHRQFGIPLAQMRGRSNATDHVPALLQMLRRELVKRDGLDCKYIYRVSPDQADIMHAKQAINSGVFSPSSVSDPHVFASLLKHWLRDLPGPLLAPISRSDIDLALHALEMAENPTDASASPQFVRPFADVHAFVTSTLLIKLPAPERDVLLWFVDHMLEVMAKSARNGMTSQSLAVVMAPNVYRWAAATPQDASAIASQIASLLRGLLLWRQRARGASALDSPPSALPRSRTGTPHATIAPTSSVRDSLNILKQSIRADTHASTVAGLLRRTNPSFSNNSPSHFVPAETMEPKEAVGRTDFCPESLEKMLRHLADSLWHELPTSLQLDDRPPIVRSLHRSFQHNTLHAIQTHSKRQHERQWAAQALQSPVHDATDSLPLGLRRYQRWIHAAFSFDAFVKLLHQERHAKQQLDKFSSSESCAGVPLAPVQILDLYRRQALVCEPDHIAGDGEKSSHAKHAALPSVLLDGAASMLQVLQSHPKSKAAEPLLSLPVAEHVAQLGEAEPALGCLLLLLSNTHANRYHLERERNAALAHVERWAKRI